MLMILCVLDLLAQTLQQLETSFDESDSMFRPNPDLLLISQRAEQKSMTLT